MTERPRDDEGSRLETEFAALLSMHALASRSAPDLGQIPGFRSAPTGRALQTLAHASLDDVPVSARIGLLGDLARAGFPDYESAESQYRELAGSVSGVRDGIDPDQLLNDLKLAASGDVLFQLTPSGLALPHEEAAFVADDVCTVRSVQIGGLEATWIFSELETDAPFDNVVAWVDPRNWPARGPMLFKAMDLIGSDSPVSLPPPGDVHWHGIFREEVRLVQRVKTLLHCDYWQDGDRAAGMTYDLALSLDRQIDVDRGFLLVNDVGPVRRVKALKIVGFKDRIWNQVAALVCPFWTDWVRAAVQGGGTSRPVTPSPGEHVGPRDGGSTWAAAAEEWIDFMSDSARPYVSLLDEMSRRYLDPDTRPAHLLQDQQRLFSQLAQDWARAWSCGTEAMSHVSRNGLEFGSFSPDPSSTGVEFTATASSTASTSAAAPDGSDVEGTTVPIGDLTPQDSPTVSDLESIEAGHARIPASSITAAVVQLGPTDYGVRLRVAASAFSPGLYVGHVSPRAGAEPVPAQLYISRSSED